MKLKKFFTKPCVLIIISAVLSALPLTFSSLFWLSWVSFVPFFYVMIKHSCDKTVLCLRNGILFGAVYHICIYYWFLWFYPLDFANLTNGSSVAVVALAWFGISLVHGALWCIPTLACKPIAKSPCLTCTVAILGILTAEKLTQISELSFPWVRVALGQYKATVLIQSASVFGIDGVDMLILSVNALIALSIVYPPKKRTVTAVTAAVVFCANMIFGFIRLNTEPQADSKDKINIMTVQGSVEQDEKWSSDGDKICYDVYTRLTTENIESDTELIIWPESAVPKVYKSEKSLSKYKKISKATDTPLLAGVLLKKNGVSTNNTLLVDKSELKSAYAKRQLVPFGEYMPYKNTLSKIFPFLNELNIIEDDYAPGTDTALMQIKDRNVGNIICFESIYPGLTRKSVADGAELMIEVTNDSWLKDSPAMWQHLAHGVFRSVENGRCLVRSANSGISATIDSKGRIKTVLEPNTQGVICDTVYFSDEQTPYTKNGDILFTSCAVVVAVWYLVFLILQLKLKIKANKIARQE